MHILPVVGFQQMGRVAMNVCPACLLLFIILSEDVSQKGGIHMSEPHFSVIPTRQIPDVWPVIPFWCIDALPLYTL